MSDLAATLTTPRTHSSVRAIATGAVIAAILDALFAVIGTLQRLCAVQS